MASQDRTRRNMMASTKNALSRLSCTICALLAVAMAFDAEAALPKMVAHRGAGDLTMPEASLPAYSNAIATACDIVKLDVQFTRDGVAVMGHDVTLKRNMDWDVRIADMTYAEILEKGRYVENGKPGELRIVRLDQALDIVKTAPELWLDFKDSERFHPWQADKALAAFRAAGIGLDRVMVATFNKKALKYVQQAHPQVRRVAHCSFEPDVDKEQEFKAILAFCREYGLFGLNMPVKKRQMNANDVEWFKSRGLWVSLWYVQDAETAVTYGTANADAFVTDNVSTVRKALSGIKK